MKYITPCIVVCILCVVFYVLLQDGGTNNSNNRNPNTSTVLKKPSKSWGDSIDKVIARERQERLQRSANQGAYSSGKYHYQVTLSGWHREWETYETEHLIDGTVRMKQVSSPDVEEYNGTYDWYMDTYLPDETAMANYIINNFSRMRQYKVSANNTRFSTAVIRDVDRHYSNDADEFNYKIDDYLDDPEDELTFPPEVFDYLDD